MYLGTSLQTRQKTATKIPVLLPVVAHLKITHLFITVCIALANITLDVVVMSAFFTIVKRTPSSICQRAVDAGT